MSVRTSCGAPGSAVPSAHTVAAMVVGPVPVTCTRACSVVPARYVSPGTTTSPPGHASTFPARRDSESATRPSASTLASTRYSLPADTRRPETYT